MTTTTTTPTARTERIVTITRDLHLRNVMTPQEAQDYIRDSVPFLLDELARLETRLEAVEATLEPFTSGAVRQVGDADRRAMRAALTTSGDPDEEVTS